MNSCHHDHEEIHEALQELREAAAADRRDSLGSLFTRFWVLLEDHMRWEEDVLFPSIERQDAAFAAGAARTLKADHATIRQFAAIAARHLRLLTISDDSLTRVRETLERVTEVLGDHDRTEAACLVGRTTTDGSSGRR